MKKIKSIGRHVIKDEKGSITSIVLVTVLFFTLTLSSGYMLAASARRTQLKSETLVKELYESQITQANSIADKLLN